MSAGSVAHWPAGASAAGGRDRPHLGAALQRATARARRRRVAWDRLVVAGVALALLVPNSSVLEHRAIVAVFLCALATGRGRAFVRDWLPLVAAAAVFVVLRQIAGASPLPRQGATVARLELALFGGAAPSAWLQQRLYSPGHPAQLDYAAAAIHASYFFGFVVVGLGTWLFARERFGAYTRLIACTFAFGSIGYFLLPTEPPWLAAREGIAPPVQRIVGETAHNTRLAAGALQFGRTWQSDPQALGDPNPVAAMPSVHTAITVALGLFLARLHRALGTAGALYAAAMAASLVYLGEHFVLDLVAGAACAGLAAALSLRRWPARAPG